MARCPILALLFALFGFAKPEQGKFEGIWKAEKPYAVLTILSDHPPRGSLSWGEGAPEFYIQDVRIVKGESLPMPDEPEEAK